MSTETPTPVRLRQGESISLLTGQVTVAPANRVRYIDRGPWTGLDANDLVSLSLYLSGAIKFRYNH